MSHSRVSQKANRSPLYTLTAAVGAARERKRSYKNTARV